MGEVVADTTVKTGAASFVKIENASMPTDRTLTDREMCDLEMLLMGAFEPLHGYLDQKNYLSVLNKMELVTGEVWPMPIVLPMPKSVVNISNNIISTPQIIKLRDCLGAIVAELTVEDIYEPNLKLEMQKVLGTTDTNHPYVQHLLKHHSDCYYVGGSLKKAHPIMHFDFNEYRLDAPTVRGMIQKKGWTKVVGFQTRNPMHRSHFELTKQALREVGDDARLLLTPAVGPTQPGDVEYHIRVRCYKKIMQYYGEGNVELVLLPLAMRMAGPREAVFHSIIRKNYGCTHFIVGRDHAGPSAKKQDGTPFYGAYEAHELIKSVQDKLGIKPVFGKNMVYVGEEHGGHIQADQKPPNVEAKSISGTHFRDLLETRQHVPEWFSFPEVVEELHKFYLPFNERGFCVYFTGLPCSGKSTLATALACRIQENEHETRNVTVLDADIIRTHLSKGLGFSREDRSANVRRIGYVSSEIVKHHGICIVANIAPYECDRKYNREIISSSGGGYIETHVSTPLEICEQRDIKELYKKAREGVIKQFTGISDPYEIPENSELVINSSKDLDDKVEQVMTYLKKCHWTI